MYKKVKVFFFAPYLRTNGLVEKITSYDDYNYTIPLKTIEIFANRDDNLIKTEKDLVNEQVVDYYKRGRADACKRKKKINHQGFWLLYKFNLGLVSLLGHEYYVRENAEVFDFRKLEFYDIVRADKQSDIVLTPNSLTQNFVNREDFMLQR